jgi:hypothetical protein
VSTEKPQSAPERGDFIREIVAADLREGRQEAIRAKRFWWTQMDGFSNLREEVVRLIASR